MSRLNVHSKDRASDGVDGGLAAYDERACKSTMSFTASQVHRGGPLIPSD